MSTKGYQLTPTLIGAAIVSALGGLLFGFDSAVIAGTTSALRQVFSLSDWQVGFVVSSALVGTVMGTLVFTKPADIWGRRSNLKVLAILFFASAIGCALAWDMWSLVFFRFIGGLGIGGASVLGPMYVAEISPAKIRGRLVILFQYNVCVGILVAFFSNALIQTMGFDVLKMEWRVMLGIGSIPALLFFILLFRIPESPRWLVAKERYAEAEKVLALVGEENISRELEDIKKSLHVTEHKTKERLFQRKYAYAIFLGVGVAAFNQLSFVNGFLYYLNDTLKEIGATFGGKFQPVIIGVANVVAVTIALFTIDKIGRKTLLLIGSWGSAIPLALCAYIAYTRHLVDLFPWSLAAFILFFSYSQGSVIWVYISEIFPNRVRSQGQSLGSFTHWGLCTIAAMVYPSVVAIKEVGLAIPFVFGGIMMVVQFFVVYFFFVETKGVPLEEMEKKLGMKD
jgi:SP family arabinose:H+ symporter-like MFS transporter